MSGAHEVVFAMGVSRIYAVVSETARDGVRELDWASNYCQWIHRDHVTVADEDVWYEADRTTYWSGDWSWIAIAI